MELDRETIANWRAQDMSDAEIGRRLGVSAEGLRALLGEAEPEGGDRDDDNRPNDAPVR